MNLKRGRVFRGCTGLAGAVLALGLTACSIPMKLPSLGGRAGATSGDGLRCS